MAREKKPWKPPKVGKTGHPYWVESKIRSTAMIQALELRAAFMVAGIPVEGKVLEAIALLAFPNDEFPVANMKIMFRQPLFRLAAAIKVQQQVRALGLTREDIIRDYEDARDIARAQGRADWMVKAIEKLERHVKFEDTNTDHMDDQLKQVLLDYDDKEEMYTIDAEAERKVLEVVGTVTGDEKHRVKKDVSKQEALLAESIKESGVVWSSDNADDDTEDESEVSL